MAQIMKVRCNGPEKHVNEIDLDRLIKGVIITRGVSPQTEDELRDRYVQTCQYCTAGRIIITREMILDFRKTLSR